jgi:hypothetical protein
MAYRDLPTLYDGTEWLSFDGETVREIPALEELSAYTRETWEWALYESPVVTEEERERLLELAS